MFSIKNSKITSRGSFKILKYLLFFISQQPIAFSIIFLLPIGVLLKTNITPYALKLLIDTLSIPTIDKGLIFFELTPPLCLTAASWIGFVFFDRLQNIMHIKTFPAFESHVRSYFFKEVLHLPVNYFYNHYLSDVSDKITSLVRSLSAIIKIFITNIVTVLIVVVFSIVLMSRVSPIFSLIAFLWVCFQLFSTIFFAKKINIEANKHAKDKYFLSGIIGDIIFNVITVKLFSKEENEASYFYKAQEFEQQSNRKFLRTLNLLCFSIDVYVTMALVAAYYFLIRGWQVNIISTGDIVFSLYMIYSIMNQMWQFSNALPELFREIGNANTALKDLQFFTPFNRSYSKDEEQTIQAGEINFQNVSFSYPGEKKLFYNLNVKIKPKEKIGIVGSSGSGKSTFINLLLNLYNTDSGTISINNHDVSKIHQSNLNNLISVVQQDVSLFHRTILENICYGNKEASVEEVTKICKIALCYDFILKKEHGFDTVIGDKGAKLSRGQRQRIAIARALLKNPKILILDEATSALDATTELMLIKNLKHYSKNITSIVIAHHLPTLIDMDRILVFDSGTIVEQGKHTELLELKGVYWKMWKDLTKPSHFLKLQMV